MEANLKTYSDLRKGLLEIPTFQRPYSWEKPNWQRLWATVLDGYMDARTSPDRHFTGDIFMGAMVRQELSWNPESAPQVHAAKSEDLTRHGIIDGQQRVITLSILVAAIRDFYFMPGSAGFAHLTGFLNFKLGLTGTETGSLRLRVQDVDTEVYERVCAPKSSLEELERLLASKHRIVQAYSFFLRALALSEDEQLTYLSEDLDRLDKSPLDDLDVEESGDEGRSKTEDVSSLEVALLAQIEARWSRESLLNPEGLLAVLENRMRFAVITLTELDQELAFEIFETLNDAGMPLSNVDKFRNGYFILAPDDAPSVFQKYWKPMELIHSSGKGRDASLNTLEDFFFNEAIRRFGWTPTDRTYQRLIGYVKGRSVEAGRGHPAKRAGQLRVAVIEDELGQILASDRAYRRVHEWLTNLEVSTPPSTRVQLDFFRDFDAKPITPILMEILAWAEPVLEDPESEAELIRALQVIEGFLVRRLLAGVPPQQLRSSVAGVARELRGSLTKEDVKTHLPLLSETLRDRFQELGERYPDDDMLRASIDVPVYATVGRGIQLFLLLWELERDMSPDHRTVGRPSYGTGRTKWSIEHVLPQGIPVPRKAKKGKQPIRPDLDPQWESYWRGLGVKDSKTEFRSVRHTLGNLTLLLGRDNSYLGNASFEQKQGFYQEKSALKLTADIEAADRWTPLEIRARTSSLLELSIVRWPH